MREANDGDKSLVCADKTIIEVAERNCKDIIPLYYVMAKAPAQKITPEALYKGMIDAYTGGNIGEISNDITKIWNSKEPNLEAIKYLCMENNFVIDYAKTLYKPVRPPYIDKMIRQAVKGKVPHFFLYAKDKKNNQIERRNSSCVNRLYDIIKVCKFNFNKEQLGTFDYKMLMFNPDTIVDPEIVKEYKKLSSSIGSYNISKDGDNNKYIMAIDNIRNISFYSW